MAFVERIGIRELRQHVSRYLAKVRSGETVEVTDRGELAALIVPPQRSSAVRERLFATGRLIPAPNPRGPAPPSRTGRLAPGCPVDNVRPRRVA
ncbi:type II toxin-antitoxin system Phd/YefM family antitoxin [Saccharomonospora glauca]|uniref:type II toxin-antitoxin system Phd/YefM family antitoxin n=1 Tax=Saccharomonospora glauca TaxID=40990 RepID=UPI0038CDA27D